MLPCAYLVSCTPVCKKYSSVCQSSSLACVALAAARTPVGEDSCEPSRSKFGVGARDGLRVQFQQVD